MNFDVAIVGGGMVGATLAVALAPLKLRVALIEAIPHNSAAQPSFDERTTALSNGSRGSWRPSGVWPALREHATPIRKIHVSDQGRFGFARIDAAEQGLAAMGYVVPNRALGRALWPRLAASPGLNVFCPAEVSQVDVERCGGVSADRRRRQPKHDRGQAHRRRRRRALRGACCVRRRRRGARL